MAEEIKTRHIKVDFPLRTYFSNGYYGRTAGHFMRMDDMEKMYNFFLSFEMNVFEVFTVEDSNGNEFCFSVCKALEIENPYICVEYIHDGITINRYGNKIHHESRTHYANHLNFTNSMDIRKEHKTWIEK